MYIVPETKEVVLHPNAKQLVKLSPPELRTRAREELAVQAGTRVPDLEIVVGLGQLARLKQLEDFDRELLALLDAQPTPSALDAACLFVSSYWSRERRPNTVLLERFLAALGVEAAPSLVALAAGDAPTEPLGLIDSLVLALGAGRQNIDDEALRAKVETAFRAIVPLAPYLQSASQGWFTAATGLPIAPPPPPFPPENYRAYSCLEGANAYYLVEQRETHREVLRVAPPVPNGTNLAITYEILEPKLKDRSAYALIRKCVLLELLENSFAKRTHLVFYTNQATKSTASEPYA